MNTRKNKTRSLHRVIVVGSGFAGIEVAKQLENQDCEVVMIDRHNYFTFQPLLYQVATGGLESGNVGYPVRKVFGKSKNIRFMMAKVERVELARQVVWAGDHSLEYDDLVIATGSKPAFFGIPPEEVLPLKTIPHALRIRNQIWLAFEQASKETSKEKRKRLLHFVIVGGGPTGLELAGALAEMKKHLIPQCYPDIDSSEMVIRLVEGLDRLLPAMSEQSSQASQKCLEKMGVHINLNTLVEAYEDGIARAGDHLFESDNLIWTAGVQGQLVSDQNDDLPTSGDRILVNRFLQVKGWKNVWAAGDVALVDSEEYEDGHPRLAPVAIQQGKLLGRNLARKLKGKDFKAFEYNNRGALATIGRNKAVADLPFTKVKGFVAWILWMALHLFTLVGFRNKLVVAINWIYHYFSYGKSLQLILDPEDAETKKVTNQGS